MGMDFNVNQAVTVTALGAFDNGNTATLAGSDGQSGVTVQIYDLSNGHSVVGPVTFTPTSAGIQQINGDAFLSLASPVTLGPGSYMIASYNDANYNAGYFSAFTPPTAPAR